MRVVKIGGSVISMLENLWRENGISEILGNSVIVHGGSRHVDELSRKMGVKIEKLTSPSGVTFRRTTKEVLKVYVAAMIRANKEIVEFLRNQGINAIGLTGLDRELIIGERKKLIKAVINGRVVAIRDDYSGVIKKVNTQILREYLKIGTPVIASIAYDPIENTPLNVDGDKVAYHVALAMDAKELYFLSDTAFMAGGKVVSELPADEIEKYLIFAKGGMKKKLLMAKEAINSGIKNVVIEGLNGRTVIY
ncbi:acetylglutamate kinase [Pyrococcus furiosus DSM 3638]|uniref:Putative [LysW]-aminoadipate/[LysW]-glutamate kinase n=3 Tax=Pyrococcus furiosus TaxID=2261 RepID=LYSZ_PYRFU|nr:MULTISPECIES: [LysW]-aminoadipate/[LysW]-glutamate kinase [Pyrococcus]Q8U0B5.1 RecName: Full=Putative [LysW]-aminoadipate/[LysW]-glutamate kinase [Pyrococcus furiosus DSM 3638]AAL81808.1 acetylglutamate kinase [Pyrococcus furiosus DSM 3638]AFN04956.1 acetylglutamate/acetylaminoadipate kinase [Pyrococcus furiosus COM1]MDK2870180.1 [amino group carrier protein]-L-2-aminoadipate 6-kinase [Pyrococcus sp.]QEK79303.1 acetylglutamate kinase [Pyrococcus furiosus DSM 3638]